MDKILVELNNPPCCGDCIFMWFDDIAIVDANYYCRHPNTAFNGIKDYHRRPHWCPFNEEYNGVVRLNDHDKED